MAASSPRRLNRRASGHEGKRGAMIRLLLEVYDQAFSGRSWHGTNLWGSIRGLTPREALWRPGRGRHNIWELVLHTAYWKHIVRRRLLADPTLEFPRPGANFPHLPDRPDARAWRRDTALLKEQHRLLRDAIRRFPSSRLRRKGWRSNWTNVQHIYGIASHDLYHTGQIQLIKAMMRR
jgi:hypothetical protein